MSIFIQRPDIYQQYVRSVRRDGATSFWGPLPSSGTNWPDQIVANGGTLTGGYTLGQQGALARAVNGGGGVLLNGSTGYINCGNIAGTTGIGSLSMECWYKPASSSGLSDNKLIAKDEVSSGRSWSLGVFSNKIALELWTGAGSGSRTALDSTGVSTTLSAGNWYHLAFVYTGSSLIAYVNGIADGSTAASGNVTTSTTVVLIGARKPSAPALFANGTITAPSITTSALTANQITYRYALATGKRSSTRFFSFPSGATVLRRILTKQAA